ncbi:MAG TPA: hypothetical protein VK737_07705 [Opitutales bacterium]|nr:hypothetical protein [Opitutales bacterium]
MRQRFIGFLGGIVTLAALTASAASTGSSAVPPSVPASDEFPPQGLPQLKFSLPTIQPITKIDALAFLPKNLLLSVSNFPPTETRTPAQLQAMLTAYVGTWRGTSTWFSSATHSILTYPTELIYKLQTENNQQTLTCSISYTINGATSTSQATFWIENGHLISEVTQNGNSQTYIAGTNHESLRWQESSTGASPLNYSETETLRLTVDGGQISTTGYQIEHGAAGDVFVYESSELKLVK